MEKNQKINTIPNCSTSKGNAINFTSKPSLQRITDILFYLSIIIFFTALNFGDNLPPGWNQQFPPVGSRNITDVQFLDTLNGWAVTNGGTSGTDTALILKTTNGGENWQRQYKYPIASSGFYKVEMLNMNTGYVSGGYGNGIVMKTTNGGLNWIDLNFTTGIRYVDMSFINADTGWICDDVFGGLWRTTDGGSSWQIQAGGDVNRVFFISSDTGWYSRYNSFVLYKTTNGGLNWNLQHSFTSQINDLFFTGQDTGWITGGGGGTGIMKTTDGGNNWLPQSNPGATTDGKLFFINSLRGWLGNDFSNILVTTNGGLWGKQITPVGGNQSVIFTDTLKGWAGGFSIIHTTDGGGEIIYNGVGNQQNIADKFILCQNYPNPFNPSTIIRFQIKRLADLKLAVYDLAGKEITVLANGEYKPGTYEVDFSGEGLSSGVYFYRITVSSAEGKEVYTQTKKMLMIK